MPLGQLLEVRGHNGPIPKKSIMCILDHCWQVPAKYFRPLKKDMVLQQLQEMVVFIPST
jgi:hypothetical protein